LGAKIGLGMDYPITDRLNIEFGTDYHYIFKGNEEILNHNRKTSFQHFHMGITYKIK
jgi:opacity protein-like surface antigen